MIVVIPTHQRPDLLERTLRSLGECRRPEEYAYCVVVENGGRHGAEEVVRGSPAWLNARYLYSAPGNKSSALNVVLDVIEDSLIVFLDDDVRLAPDLLCAYAEMARRHPTGFFFGGPVAPDFEEEPEEYLQSYFPPSVRGWQWSGDEPILDKPAFLGCNWAAHRRDLKACGGFDPTVGPGGASGARGQETECQMRLLRNGLQGRYVPEAMVWHYIPKERCSAQWLYHRTYQSSASEGLSYTGKEFRVAGVPLWVYKGIVVSYLQSLLARWGKDRSAVFRTTREYWMMRGWLHGCRYALRNVRQCRHTPPDSSILEKHLEGEDGSGNAAIGS